MSVNRRRNFPLILPLFLLAAASLACLSLGTAPEVIDITGTYDVQGTNPDGTQYEGQATITREGDSYTIRWDIGVDTFIGTGTWDNERFEVVWEAGPVTYTRTASGVLEGVWSIDGDPRQGTETLTPR